MPVQIKLRQEAERPEIRQFRKVPARKRFVHFIWINSDLDNFITMVEFSQWGAFADPENKWSGHHKVRFSVAHHTEHQHRTKAPFSVESVIADLRIVPLGRVEVPSVDLQVFSVLNGRVDHQEQVGDALLVVDVQRKELDQTVVVLPREKSGIFIRLGQSGGATK